MTPGRGGPNQSDPWAARRQLIADPESPGVGGLGGLLVENQDTLELDEDTALFVKVAVVLKPQTDEAVHAPRLDVRIALCLGLGGREVAAARPMVKTAPIDDSPCCRR